MSHRSGLIGQQTEIVFVILNLFFNVLEFAGYAGTAITWETWSERVGVAHAILCVAAAVL